MARIHWRLGALAILLIWLDKRFLFHRPNYSINVREVEQLHKAAREAQLALEQRQSKTLEDASAEYERRYQIPPPEGYDKWFAYAKKFESAIIDDFDDLMADLRPFRAYQKTRCDMEKQRVTDPAVIPVCIVNGTLDIPSQLSNDARKNVVDPLRDLLEDIVEHIPDVCFEVNTHEEPQSLISREKREALTGNENSRSCEPQKFADLKYKYTWPDVIEPCPPGAPASTGRENSSYAGVYLARTWKEATDICSFTRTPPSGIVRQPESLMLSKQARPILSLGKLSTFSDVLRPDLSRLKGDSSEILDLVPWDRKSNTMGWRGSSTGGYASSNGEWRNYQRHRMVALAHGETLFGTSSQVTQAGTLFQNQLNVRFVDVVSCEGRVCDQIKRELPPVKYQSVTELYANKLVLDMDGHGVSGQLIDLLRSNSLVVRQGLLRQWHDGRLQPWLHYVPLTMNLLELESLLDYLLGDGEAIAAAIAAEGKAWATRSLRKQDVRVYMYRLLLEMSRRTFN